MYFHTKYVVSVNSPTTYVTLQGEVDMCSEYTLKSDPKHVEAALGFGLINKTNEAVWDKTIKMYTQGPVIELADDGPVLVTKTFPSSPMPNSRLSGIGNQSEGNDPDEESEHRQIKRIYEMPRWKDGFKTHPLLIPMTNFTEFAYWGDQIGTAQAFKIPDQDVLFAAGIAIKPFTPKGNKEDGFSILTHTATKQMLDYHHRLIVLLKPETAFGYLEPMEPEERFNYLIENRYTGPLEVHKIRNMAKGWEKRAPQQVAKLHREEEYRATIAKEHVEG